MKTVPRLCDVFGEARPGAKPEEVPHLRWSVVSTKLQSRDIELFFGFELFIAHILVCL